MKNLQYTWRFLSTVPLLLAALGSCSQEQAKQQNEQGIEAPQETYIGMPWMHENCWLSSSLHAIVKFFPNIFKDKDDPFAKAVDAVWDKLRHDKGVTWEETEKIYNTFWETFPGYPGEKLKKNYLALDKIIEKYAPNSTVGEIMCKQTANLQEEQVLAQNLLTALTKQHADIEGVAKKYQQDLENDREIYLLSVNKDTVESDIKPAYIEPSSVSEQNIALDLGRGEKLLLSHHLIESFVLKALIGHNNYDYDHIKIRNFKIPPKSLLTAEVL